MKITVLRLGHRFIRDRRVSTHLGLVARAFGADELVFDTRDDSIKKSIEKVTQEWGGGNFEINFIKDPMRYIKNFPGDKIHLTMYGINVDEKVEKIRKSKRDKLIIVGGKKVPSEVYSLADYNIAIGQQPHSEIAALAIFLDRIFQGNELRKKFEGGKKRIIPKERGKEILER
jgi:tRNA (cytidine56-2'-O)-methyltransferase